MSASALFINAYECRSKYIGELHSMHELAFFCSSKKRSFCSALCACVCVCGFIISIVICAFLQFANLDWNACKWVDEIKMKTCTFATAWYLLLKKWHQIFFLHLIPYLCLFSTNEKCKEEKPSPK